MIELEIERDEEKERSETVWFAILEWPLFLPGYGDPNEMSYKVFRAESPEQAVYDALEWAGDRLHDSVKWRVLGVWEWR